MHFHSSLVVLVGVEHATVLAYQDERLTSRLQIPLAPHLVDAACRALAGTLHHLPHDQVLFATALGTPDELRDAVLELVERHGQERRIPVARIPDPAEFARALALRRPRRRPLNSSFAEAYE